MASLKNLTSRSKDFEPPETSDGVITLSMINTSCFMRIADGIEVMGQNYLNLQGDVDYYKREYRRKQAECQTLKREVAAQKGAKTKLKNKSVMAINAAIGDTADISTAPFGVFGSKCNDIWLASLAKTLDIKLRKVQGDLIHLIMQECDKNHVTDPRQVAYVLGTCFHECEFKCVVERRDKVGTEVWKMQEKYWHTGFMGRGPSQITGEKNYRRMSAVVGIDLVKNPDAALRMDVGARLLVVGMVAGLYTGHDLGDYFPVTGFQVRNWLLARQIYNGMFHAKEVAAAAIKILTIL